MILGTNNITLYNLFHKRGMRIKFVSRYYEKNVRGNVFYRFYWSESGKSCI